MKDGSNTTCRLVVAHSIMEAKARTLRQFSDCDRTKGRAILMPKDVDALREVEQLLREAKEKLGPVATFRQRTLLQMILFEVERGLQPGDGHDEAGQSPVEPRRDESDG